MIKLSFPTLTKTSANAEFTTLSEALNAVPYAIPARIELAEGVYHEKIFSENQYLSISGAGEDKTILQFADYANMLHPETEKLGTFRSYSAFFGGEKLRLQNLTIENNSGPGYEFGQAIAAYMDADIVHCTNVNFKGWQDTLFCAPLPEKERQPNGFIGPRCNSPRRPSLQLYENCSISGSVDFIFGGADVVFKDCRIICRPLHEGEDGFIAAPSSLPGHAGMIFINCEITGESLTKEGSYQLARPWRENGRAAFLNCSISPVINQDRFDYWNDPQVRGTKQLFDDSTMNDAKEQKYRYEQANRIIDQIITGSENE